MLQVDTVQHLRSVVTDHLKRLVDTVYAPQAVQVHPNGGQFEFARSSARTRLPVRPTGVGVRRTCGWVG